MKQHQAAGRWTMYALAALAAGCAGTTTDEDRDLDASTSTPGVSDAGGSRTDGLDAGGSDAGRVDAGRPDIDPGDAGVWDAGRRDAGERDAGSSSTSDGGGGVPASITVWIAGDSTVATGGASCPAGWGGQFAGFFDGHVRVVNSARGGRSVRTWLYSVQTSMDATGECLLDRDSIGNLVVQKEWREMLDGMKSGDFLFIQFGINDGSATCDRHVGLAAFKDSYAMMAQAAKDRGAQPIFVTPVSAIACNGSVAKGTRGGYVTATQEAGREHGVSVIDLHASSVALYTSHGFCPIPGGDVSATTMGPVGDFFCNDHTHFEKSGALEIAGLVARALRDQRIGPFALLKEP